MHRIQESMRCAKTTAGGNQQKKTKKQRLLDIALGCTSLENGNVILDHSNKKVTLRLRLGARRRSRGGG